MTRQTWERWVGTISHRRVSQELAAMGAEGWEVVAAQLLHSSGDVFAVLKRPAP
jgi:hypothetical protein